MNCIKTSRPSQQLSQENFHSLDSLPRVTDESVLRRGDELYQNLSASSTGFGRNFHLVRSARLVFAAGP